MPALILPDGFVLAESIAICKYLDAAQGGTSLVGTTPKELGETDMWILRSEQKILEPMGCAFRNGPMFGFFEKRRPGYMHKELAPPNAIAGQAGLAWLDSQLADGRAFLCGERFTLADIRFYCLYSFFAKADKSQTAPESLKNFHAYILRCSARPSAAAIIPKKKSKL